jgi:hypothetical protein
VRTETAYVRAAPSALVPHGQYKLELSTRRGLVREVVIAERVIEAGRRETVYELAISRINRSRLSWRGRVRYSGFHAECQLPQPPGACLIAPAFETSLDASTPSETLIALYRQALVVVDAAGRHASIARQDASISW